MSGSPFICLNLLSRHKDRVFDSTIIIDWPSRIGKKIGCGTGGPPPSCLPQTRCSTPSCQKEEKLYTKSKSKRVLKFSKKNINTVDGEK